MDGTNSTFPVVGIIGDNRPTDWTKTGSYSIHASYHDQHDLIEVLPTITVKLWLNIYGSGTPGVYWGYSHSSENYAIDSSMPTSNTIVRGVPFEWTGIPLYSKGK